MRLVMAVTLKPTIESNDNSTTTKDQMLLDCLSTRCMHMMALLALRDD